MLPDRPINFVPKLPAEFDELICSLLMKDPARRPASAAALLDDLEHLRGKLERMGGRVCCPPETVDPTGTHAPLDLSADQLVLAENDSSRRRERPAPRRHRRGALLARRRPDSLRVLPAAAERRGALDPSQAARRERQSRRLGPCPRAVSGQARALAPPARMPANSKPCGSGWPIAANSSGRSSPARTSSRPARRSGFTAAGWPSRKTATSPRPKLLWTALAKAYSANPADRRWVALSDTGAGEMARYQSHEASDPRASVTVLVAIAKKMRAEGHAADAEAIVSALHSLYRDQPEIVELLK